MMTAVDLVEDSGECRPDVEIIIVSGRVRPEPNVLPARSMFFSKPYNTGYLAQQLHRMASNEEPQFERRSDGAPEPSLS